MGVLFSTNQRILEYGKYGTLVYQTDKESQKKIPAFNQPVISYQDTDGQKKWVTVENGDNGSILYQGKTFADANELVSALVTPIPEPATAPKVLPPDAVTQAAPKVSANQEERNRFSAKTRRVARNYLGKMVSGVGAAFANTASMIPGAFSGVVSLEAQERQLARDRENLKRLKQTAWDTTEEEQRIGDMAARIGRIKAGEKPQDTAYKAQKKLEGLSDRLAEMSEAYQTAAEAEAAPVLRPFLNVATDLVPFFAINL